MGSARHKLNVGTGACGLCVLLAAASGCTTGRREAHFASRLNVVQAQEGDGSMRATVWPAPANDAVAAVAASDSSRRVTDDLP